MVRSRDAKRLPSLSESHCLWRDHPDTFPLCPTLKVPILIFHYSPTKSRCSVRPTSRRDRRFMCTSFLSDRLPCQNKDELLRRGPIHSYPPVNRVIYRARSALKKESPCYRALMAALRIYGLAGLKQTKGCKVNQLAIISCAQNDA